MWKVTRNLGFSEPWELLSARRSLQYYNEDTPVSECSERTLRKFKLEELSGLELGDSSKCDSVHTLEIEMVSAARSPDSVIMIVTGIRTNAEVYIMIYRHA